MKNKELPSVAQMKGVLKDDPPQEWTADRVKDYYGNEKGLADIINAALAAEREKYRPSEIAGIKVRWPE